MLSVQLRKGCTASEKKLKFIICRSLTHNFCHIIKNYTEITGLARKKENVTNDQEEKIDIRNRSKDHPDTDVSRPGL